MKIKPIEFKTKRIEDEYAQLDEKNHPLLCLLDSVNMFTNLEFGKSVMLTEIFRSQEEFDALYQLTPPGLRPKSSPHMFWKAADIRSWTFTEAEIERVLDYCNSFRYVEGRSVAIYHKIRGNAAHFHIQYVGNAK